MVLEVDGKIILAETMRVHVRVYVRAHHAVPAGETSKVSAYFGCLLTDAPSHAEWLLRDNKLRCSPLNRLLMGHSFAGMWEIVPTQSTWLCASAKHSFTLMI